MLLKLNFVKGKLKIQHQKLLFILAFAAVYILWGSTYYSIKVAILTIPPFLMAGTRFVLAGAVLFIAALISGVSMPRLSAWKENAVLGFFLLLMGNGGIVWASERVPSGIIALLITIEPMWVLLLSLFKKGGKLPGIQTIIGIGMGLVGTFLLLAPGKLGSFSIDPIGLIAILISTICWAIGSLYAVKANEGINSSLSTGIQMLCGGIYMFVTGLLKGEAQALNFASFSIESLYAVLYLIVFGSIIGFSAYSYLLKTANPNQVATYAYVNPLVAVLIGTFLGKEAFNLQIAVSAAFLLAGVVLVLTKKDTPGKQFFAQKASINRHRGKRGREKRAASVC